MAWRIEIGGVNKTTSIASGRTTQITRMLNERAKMRFSAAPGYVPARFAEVVAYARDGTTPLFGGVVLTRASADFGSPLATPFFTDIDCGDYLTYFDWAYNTLTYIAPVTLETVLNDIVSQLPGSYGITVDATQVTGPTLAPFSWVRKRASDAVRELSDRTGYVALVSPLKALKMFVPGTDPAPFAMTDSATHCRSFHWRDSDRKPANTVTGIFGPTGPQVTEQLWTADGIATSWEVDIQTVLGAWNRGLINEGGTDRTLSGVGGGGYYEWDETDGLGTISVGAGATPGAATVLSFVYTAQYPFTVTETSGATPVIEDQYADPSIVVYAQGVEDVQGRLAQLDQQPREIDVMSIDGGWAPGQALSVTVTGRLTADFIITEDTITLKTNEFWEHQFRATESETYQGSYLEQWREMTGGSSGISTVSGGGGSTVVTVLSSPVYMGGSTATAVTNPTTKKLIPNAAVYVASATFTGRLRVSIRARDGGVGVKAIISDGTTDTATSVVTSTTFTPITAIVAIVSGQTYRVYLENTAAGDGYCEYAMLEAA